MQVTYTNIIIAGFHALSEPLRIKVLQLLRKQEMCVCDLCDILGVIDILAALLGRRFPSIQATGVE